MSFLHAVSAPVICGYSNTPAISQERNLERYVVTLEDVKSPSLDVQFGSSNEVLPEVDTSITSDNVDYSLSEGIFYSESS